MSLALDARQHAMLQEMGLRLFDPQAHPGLAASNSAVTESLARARPLTTVAVASDGPAVATTAPVAAKVAPNGSPGRGLPDPGGPASGATDSMDWSALAAAVAACRACALCEGRRNPVFGIGDRQADWLIIGDAPADMEDLQAEPFVGQAGQLLDNMLKALGLNRHEQVYLTNALKCRPPGNRNPEPAEAAQCEPYLRRQVELLRPRIILAMGRFAVQSLLQSNEPIGKLRGRVHRYHGVPVVVTFHPAYLLRNLADKARAWTDLCLALEVVRQPERHQDGKGA